LSVDAVKNFALAFVEVGPTPSTSGKTLTLVSSGELTAQEIFPAAPFNATCWAPGVAPLRENAEIARVSSIVGNVVTFSARAQEGTPAREIEAGWQFADMLTAHTIESLAEAIVAAQAAAEAAATADVKVEKERAEAAEALKAPLASPALTGTPKAPTQAAKDNTTAIATDQFVQTAKGEAEAASDKAGAASAAQTAAEAAAAADVAVETSRAKAAEAEAVKLTGNQTVAGVKAFSASPTVPTPTEATQAVNKAYADAIAANLSPKESVALATTTALPANTYLTGVLTAAANGALTVDAKAVAVGQRVLVKNEAAQANNGLYVVTAAGGPEAKYVLTRTTDMSTGAQVKGAFVFVEAGEKNEGAGFTVVGEGPYTIGVTAIVWTQFSGAGEITAGSGLEKVGNTLNATPERTAREAAVAAAQAAAEAASIPLTQKGAASGVASLTAGSIGAQPPAHHASTHAEAGSDPLTTADLPASVVSSSIEPPDQALLVCTGTGSDVVPLDVGSTGKQLMVRSDGTVRWIEAPEIVVDSFTGTDWERLKAAFNVVNTAENGVVKLGAREYSLAPDSPETLMPKAGLAGWVRLKGAGMGATKIKLSTNCPSLLSGGTAEEATLQNVAVEDLTVNNNNVATENIGIVANFFNIQCNLENLIFRNISVINAGELSAASRRCFSIGVTRSDAFGATQNTIKHLLFENIYCGLTGGGGDSGLLVLPYYSGEKQGIEAYEKATVPVANVFVDDVTVRNFWWSSGQKVPTTVANGNSSGLQVGGDGNCGKVVLDNIYIYGSGDAGIEIDGCRELDASNIHAENCLNEGMVITANNGGLPNPEQQTINITNLTCVRSESRWTLMAGLWIWGVHGAKYGTINVTNFTFKHTAPKFEATAGGFQNPSTQPLIISADFRKVSIKNASIIYDGLALVSTANAQTQEPAGIAITQEGGTGAVEIDGAQFEFNGEANSEAFTTCSLQVPAVLIGGASRLVLDVRSLGVKANLKLAGTFAFRLRDVQIKSGSTCLDKWNAAESISLAYVLRTGSRTGLSQSTVNKKLECTANPAERRIFRAPAVGQAVIPFNQVGNVMDGAMYVQGITPATSITGWELLAVAKMNEAKGNEIRAILSDNGTNTSLRIEEVIANGAPTVLVTENLASRIAVATTVGVRIKLQGNTVYADYFTGSSEPALKAEGTNRVTVTLTTTTQKTTFGAESQPRGMGWGWTPGETTASLTLLRHDRMLVISGAIDGLRDMGDAEAPGRHQGLQIENNTAEGVRIEGILHCRRWNRQAVLGQASIEDVAFGQGAGNEALKTKIMLTDSYLAKPPAAAALSVTASPYTYTNEDMVPEDIFVYGGALTTPYLKVTRQEGGTSQVVGSSVASAAAVVRLNPGDSVEATYTATAPTMNKSPIVA